MMCVHLLLPKSRYFERRDYAGRYFPNPFFDRDMGSVRVRTRLGFRRRRVIREAVPERFKDFPQYASGEWSFIEGYRPKLK
jgi:type IV secretion system protein VirD4